MITVARALMGLLMLALLTACGAGEIAEEVTGEVSVMAGSQREALESAGFQSVVVIDATTAKEEFTVVIVDSRSRELTTDLVYWTRPPEGREEGWYHNGIHLGIDTPTPEEVLTAIEAGQPTGFPSASAP